MKKCLMAICVVSYGSGGNIYVDQIVYELWDNGAMVLTGTAHLIDNAINYLVFSGGGFDTIRLHDNFNVPDYEIEYLVIMATIPNNVIDLKFPNLT